MFTMGYSSGGFETYHDGGTESYYYSSDSTGSNDTSVYTDTYGTTTTSTYYDYGSGTTSTTESYTSNSGK